MTKITICQQCTTPYLKANTSIGLMITTSDDNNKYIHYTTKALVVKMASADNNGPLLYSALCQAKDL